MAATPLDSPIRAPTTRRGDPSRPASGSLKAEGMRAVPAFRPVSRRDHGVFHLLKPGDHVLAPRELLLRHAPAAQGVPEWLGRTHGCFIDMPDLRELDAHLNPEDAAHLDRDAMQPNAEGHGYPGSRRARSIRRRPACACYNTFPTPVLASGRWILACSDLVVHSSTKYFGGHSDVMGGAVITRDSARAAAVTSTRPWAGRSLHRSIVAHCRSLATLPLRVRSQSASALEVAAFLSGHAWRVERVCYPRPRK